MGTHLGFTRTGTAPQQFADQLTEKLLAMRGTLPAAPNGKPPRCRSARGAYLTNEIGAGRMKPVHAIVELMDDFLESRGSHAEPLAILDELHAWVEMRAIEVHQERQQYPPLALIPKLSLAETLAECRANPMQERMVTNLSDVGAMKAFRRVGGRHYAELGTLLHEVDKAILSVERTPDMRIVR